MHYGQKLLKFRESLGLSQKEFAMEIGFTQSSVSCWENNIHPISYKGEMAIRTYAIYKGKRIGQLRR